VQPGLAAAVEGGGAGGVQLRTSADALDQQQLAEGVQGFVAVDDVQVGEVEPGEGGVQPVGVALGNAL